MVILDSFEHEMQYGSSFDHFVALVNMTKELRPLHYNKEELLAIWKKYRLHNEEQNTYRLDPYQFAGFKEIVGQANLESCFQQGGVFATFHFGHYRHVPFEVYERVNTNRENKLEIVVDRESYESEKTLTKWNELRQERNVHYIVAEEQNSGLKLLKLLRQGGSIFLYLDGNTGAGKDSNPLSIQHITSTIRLRSGIFRLVQLTKKPICLVLSDLNEAGEPRLTAYPLLTITRENFDDKVECIYGWFREKVKKQPELWRFWYRHHHYVEQWATWESPSDRPVSIDWTCDQNLGIDLTTGQIYKL